MKLVLAAFLALTAAHSPLRAETWQPTPGHEQIQLWPGGIAPGAKPAAEPEFSVPVTDKVKGTLKLVGGKPWTWVTNVSTPTMIVYPAEGKNTGAAVMVYPGGGYQGLAIDLEGTEVCDWLTPKGITCVLLKYRTPCKRTGPYRDCVPAFQDAQRALGLLRSRAAEYKIDPKKIGVLGFSAGGHMVAAVSTHWPKRLYAPVDEADQVSCRPDFVVSLYPGHIAVPETKPKWAPNPDLKFTKDTPPTMLIQAEDDPVDPIENSLVYHAALKKAGVPVEMHLYAKGGHAFGLRPTEQPATKWPALVEDWLKTIGMTAEKK
jgi:acetyl esterase/lipase